MNELLFKTLRKLFNPPSDWYTERYVQLKGQNANDYLRMRIEKSLQESTGLLACKWGTIELVNACAVKAEGNNTPLNYIRAARSNISLNLEGASVGLCNNAGFFPRNLSLVRKWGKEVLRDARKIDILASYQLQEGYLHEELKNSKKIDLDGFYAPFLWENPWTKELEGKKVLVIHPFVDSIKKQYARRENLFENPEVLPEFESLICIKSVQSIAGNEQPYEDWFEALHYMEKKIDETEFDVALIGCGAYGMELAAYIKGKEKVAIQLGGWTQMLFGIYGNRWLNDQPQYMRFINEYWIRPSKDEKPKGADHVENACYW